MLELDIYKKNWSNSNKLCPRHILESKLVHRSYKMHIYLNVEKS